MGSSTTAGNQSPPSCSTRRSLWGGRQEEENMLQGAAGSACSSRWWANHIRTSQSKWLEESSQDMESKVKSMLEIIEEDADSFAKRAEMYYRRRPELTCLVQQSYNSYRALAERYDRISGELQKANSIIATIFPDNVHFGEEDEGDSDSSKATKIDLSSSQKTPPQSSQVDLYKDIVSSLAPKQPKHKRSDSEVSEEQAGEEIGQLEKQILVLQTEKEFIKASYLSGLAKYCDTEKKITVMQAKICSFKDEFNTTTVINDGDTQALITAATLKSCEDTLISLYEKHTRMSEDARLESQRTKAAWEKLRALKSENTLSEVHDQENIDEVSLPLSPISEKLEGVFLKWPTLELQSICNRVQENFDMNSEVYTTEAADKIDKLVNKVIALEIEVSSQAAQIFLLKLENNKLHKHLQNFNDEKPNSMGITKDLSDELKQTEKQLFKIQEIDKSIQNESIKLQQHYLDVCHAFNDLSFSLQARMQLDEVNTSGWVQEQVSATVDERQENEAETTDSSEKDYEDYTSVNGQTESNFPDDVAKGPEEMEQKVIILGSTNEQLDVAEKITSKDDDDFPTLNWQELFLNGVEEREKTLLTEYTSILRNYKGTKRELAEVEKKNQECLFEKMDKIRELQNDIAIKDEEIWSLKQMLSFLEIDGNEYAASNMENPKPSLSQSIDSIEHEAGLLLSTSLAESLDAPNFEILNDQNVEQKVEDSTGQEEIACERLIVNEAKDQINDSRPLTTIEEKFRKDIDKLLDENLEFWMRFTALFERIQNYQTVIQGVQAETHELSDVKKNKSITISSGEQPAKQEAASMHQQLETLQIEMSAWMDQNAVLKEELKTRFSSLNNIIQEISVISKRSIESEEDQLTEYQAAKFHGEVKNMQKENNQVAEELQAGLDHVKGLYGEVTKALRKLNSGSSGTKSHRRQHFRNFSARRPLQLFHFGGKPMKAPIFQCMKPAMQKQYSDVNAGPPP